MNLSSTFRLIALAALVTAPVLAQQTTRRVIVVPAGAKSFGERFSNVRNFPIACSLEKWGREGSFAKFGISQKLPFLRSTKLVKYEIFEKYNSNLVL